MDKKEKKRLEILRQRFDKTQKLIVAAQAQPDDPQELIDLRKQLVDIENEIQELKKK